MYNNKMPWDKSLPYTKSRVASIITQFDSPTNSGSISHVSSVTPGSHTTQQTPVSSHISHTTQQTPVSHISQTPVQDSGASNGVSLLYEVIKEFNARLGDELDLKVGQKVQVISDDSEYNDGWYMGKNLDTGKVGLYPKTFTQIVPNFQSSNSTNLYGKPPLLRSRSRRLNSPSSQQASPITPSASSTTTNFPPPVSLFSSGGVSGLYNHTPVESSTDSLAQQFKPTISREPSTRQSSVHTNTIKDIDNALAELSSVNGDFDPVTVNSWTPEQVSSYFSSIGVDVESAGQFARHKITGAILLELELSHLKELDISSFGTRFEIFKAIEALKIESRNKNSISNSTSTPVHSSLMPPPAVNRATGTAPLMGGQQRRQSQLLDDQEDPNSKTPSQKPRSRTASADLRPSNRNSFIDALPPPSKPLLRNENSSSSSSSGSLQQQQQQQQLGSDQLFMSPRKAPAPPTDSSNRLNSAYKFGSGSTTNLNSTLTPQFSRLSTLPEKERQLSTTSRPTSSIYHSRSSSIPVVSVSPTRGHKHSNSINKNAHKRHSSVFSFISGGGSINAGNDPYRASSPQGKRNSVVNLLSSPSKISLIPKSKKADASDDEDTDLTDLSPVNNSLTPSKVKSPGKSKKSSPYRRSVSVQISSPQPIDPLTLQKRATSETSRMKSLRNASSNFSRSKTKTSLFKEGIQMISPDDAIKTADHYGWMYKKGSLNFKKRYFTLHGTRLSYFQSLKDTHERGLIDIQAHKVLPTDNNDLKALILSSTATARYSFKLIPPAPGSKKGLTFTQPKVHFFAVSTKEELRAWMAALMKATIDMDETVPVVSSYTSATISLKQAQALQQKTSERALQMTKNGFPGDDTLSSTDISNYETPKLQQNSRLSSRETPRDDGQSSEYDENSGTVDDESTGGFDSPYLLASGLLSPKSPTSNHSDENGSNISRPNGIQRTKTFGTNPVPTVTNLENGTTSNSSPAAIAAANGAMKKK